MFGATARRTVFWALDTLRGEPVRRHMQDIEEIMRGDRPAFTTLPQLLSHAIQTVPYYRNIPSATISAFPVVRKETYQSNLDAFHSSAFSHGSLHCVTTSGSTGEPLVVLQDAGKRHRNAADLIYFHRDRGWHIGDRFVFLRAWSRLLRKPRLSHIKQNSIPIDVIHFSDGEKERLRTLLKRDRNIKAMLGYASALDEFVSYLALRGDDASMFNLNVIISDSDTLTPATKAALENMFGCPVVDRYSSEEQGLLACTKPSESEYEINRASYFLELLKLGSDEPAEPGEAGRVVVTDLYNKAMPLIRYDIGDLAISDDPDRTHLRFLRSLNGRVADMLVATSGRPISAILLDAALEEVPNLRKYQCIQSGAAQFAMKIITQPGFDSEKLLLDRLHECLGEEAKIDLHYVKEIPNAPNGKFKTTISALSLPEQTLS